MILFFQLNKYQTCKVTYPPKLVHFNQAQYIWTHNLKNNANMDSIYPVHFKKIQIRNYTPRLIIIVLQQTV